MLSLSNATSVMARMVESTNTRSCVSRLHCWTPTLVNASHATSSNSIISAHPFTTLRNPSSVMPLPDKVRIFSCAQNWPNLFKVRSVMFLHSERSTWSSRFPACSEIPWNASSEISAHLRRINVWRFDFTASRLCTDIS